MLQPQHGKQILASKRNALLSKPPLLLHNFPREDISDFLDAGVIEHYNLGDFIMKEGEVGTSACLIVSGLVSIWKRGNLIVTLRGGEFIGEMFLFSHSRRIANVLAEDDTTILRFYRNAMLEFFRKKPERLFKIFTMNIINIQQQKIEAMDNKIITLQQKLKDVKSKQGSEI